MLFPSNLCRRTEKQQKLELAFQSGRCHYPPPLTQLEGTLCTFDVEPLLTIISWPALMCVRVGKSLRESNKQTFEKEQKDVRLRHIFSWKGLFNLL